MKISLEYYKIFYYVAKNQNITLASKELFLSQPTVSKYIKTLEQELSCTLFVRSKKGVRLTPEAKRLYEHISVAYAHILKAEEELLYSRELKSGVIHIAANEMTMCGFLMPYLHEFRNKYPAVKLKISALTTPKAIEMLNGGLVDFAVIISPIDDKSLNVTKLCDLKDIFVAKKDYFLKKSAPQSLNELCGYPLICLEEGTASRIYLDGLLKRNGVKLAPDIVLDSTDVIVSSVMQGLGIGFVPESFVENEIKTGKLIKLSLKEKIRPREICFVSSGQYPLSVGSKAFADILLKKLTKGCI